MPNQNQISPEELSDWRRDKVTQSLFEGLANSIGEIKEDMTIYSSNQTMENVRYNQGFIAALMQVLVYGLKEEE